uniref:Ig-like domain-containing protein n=1 Tax=Terrapene triunguis TaxID=2587831 RepID=A0A674JQ49_9SAUR
ATLRFLILVLLWMGSLSQLPGFTLTVPQSVSVQVGLCVLVPCTFTYPASYDTDNPRAQLYRYWYKDPADVGQNTPVASSDSNRGVSQETQGRFRLAENPAHGDCSLQISDAQQTDAGRYFLRVEKGKLKYSYRSSADGTDFTLTISVPGKSTEGDVVSLEIQEGDSLNLSCEASSRPEATLSWAKGNESLSSRQGGDGHLELPNLSRGDAGEYRCWAKNSYGLASRALNVDMQCKELGGARPQGGASVEGAGFPATGFLSLTIVAVSPALSRQPSARDWAELVLPAPEAQRQLQLLPALPPPTSAPVAGGRGAPGWERLTGGPAGQLVGPGGRGRQYPELNGERGWRPPDLLPRLQPLRVPYFTAEPTRNR